MNVVVYDDFKYNLLFKKNHLQYFLLDFWLSEHRVKLTTQLISSNNKFHNFELLVELISYPPHAFLNFQRSAPLDNSLVLFPSDVESLIC